MRLTQQKIADILGVSQQTISNLVLGKKGLRPEKAKLAGRVFGCDPFIFLDKDPEAVKAVFAVASEKAEECKN